MVSGHHVGRRRRRWRTVALLVGAAVLALVATFAGLQMLDPGSPAAQAGDDQCQPTPVTVTVSPLLAPSLAEAVEGVTTECRPVTVSPRTEVEVLEGVFFGGSAPEVWIPEGEWNLEKVPASVVAESVASTPALLVGGPASRRPATWAAALASGRVDLDDPLGDTLGALATVLPKVEAGPDADPAAAEASLVSVAQRYGDLAARGEQIDATLDGLAGTTRRQVVATEAEFLTARRTSPELVATTPRTGTGLLRFPIGVLEQAPTAARTVAEELAAWFESDAGIASLTSHGLRRGDGTPSAPGAGAGTLSFLPAPGSADVDASLLTWRRLTIPSSVLAVFDVSGSMDFPAPGGVRRIDVAVDAATTALAVFPDHARLGLWAFSIGRGPDGQDWEVLEPTRRLDEVVDGVVHRDRLAARAEEMKENTDGGTGLYDTALAAYRTAMDDYDPNYSNTVVLLTDGANEDPGSISETQLLRRLARLVDPKRPVRIIGIAVSADADLASIRRIAAATGSTAYRTDTAEDLLKVFAQEIAGR